MELRNDFIAIPDVLVSREGYASASDVGIINNNVNHLIANQQELASYIEGYIKNEIKKNEQQLIEKIASKTYDIISQMMEVNMLKEEFIHLLEMSE